MAETVLKLTNITKTYKGQKAVDNVSMTIQKGDIYGLIGKNGAGKTTLQRVITALTFADSGEIELFGQTSPTGLQKARKRIAGIIEGPAFYPNLSAAHNLEYYQRLKGIPDKNAIYKTLEVVGLSDVAKKKYKSFSLGMKQRLAIALSLLTSPDLLMLDEPINGLDPAGIVEMRELIKRLNEEYRTTILISSHILSELALVANRYGIIEQGKMIVELTQEELEEKCQKSLSIQTDDAAKAAAVIETSLDTTNYKIINDKEIRLYDYLTDVAEVNRQLVTNDVRVLSIQEVGDSLESYYMSITQGGKVHV